MDKVQNQAFSQGQKLRKPYLAMHLLLRLASQALTSMFLLLL